jgi:hypothetical protein
MVCRQVTAESRRSLVLKFLFASMNARRLVVPAVAIMLLPIFQAPPAEAETASVPELTCEAADANGDCRSEDALADETMEDLEYDESCQITVTRQETFEAEGECCFTIDVYCDSPGGCRD